jgi:hypothetical protein
MDGHCETCRHWQRDVNLDHLHEYASPDSLALAVDAALYTSPRFGCVQWAPAE